MQQEKKRTAADAMNTMSTLIESKGLIDLSHDETRTIAFEAGYVVGRLLKRLGIRTGSGLARRGKRHGEPTP